MPARIWRRESVVDVINLILGVGLIAAPWIFGFTRVEMASRHAVMAGALISVTAILTLVVFAEWEEWVIFLLGLWVAASPWALSFDLLISETALCAQAALGLAIAALAGVELRRLHRTSPRLSA